MGGRQSLQGNIHTKELFSYATTWFRRFCCARVPVREGTVPIIIFLLLTATLPTSCAETLLNLKMTSKQVRKLAMQSSQSRLCSRFLVAKLSLGALFWFRSSSACQPSAQRTRPPKRRRLLRYTPELAETYRDVCCFHLDSRASLLSAGDGQRKPGRCPRLRRGTHVLSL